MARPVTMFTGQWADLSLEELAGKCKGFGYEGLELACWGDHFEVDKALAEHERRDLVPRLVREEELGLLLEAGDVEQLHVEAAAHAAAAGRERRTRLAKPAGIGEEA